MVQLVRSKNKLRQGPERASFGNNLPDKVVIEDPLEEEHGPFNKKSRTSSRPPSNVNQQWSTGSNEFVIPPSQYNPLNEPSPLGLKLRKSSSFLNLLEIALSQGSAIATAPTGNLSLAEKKDASSTSASGSTEKLKASNFPGALLKIGLWEYVSRHEGDLVAKCYFAKHKLVWEVLEGGLKSKIEIQWSDIMALKANCPHNGPGTLTIVLARPPLFFRETNPQPRKHTLWQTSADFTDGQASIHRQHLLQCPKGLLNKHYENLIQCDIRLNILSQQPEIILDSPYFEEQASVFDESNKSRGHGVKEPETVKGSPVCVFQNVASPSGMQDSFAAACESLDKEAPSPSSVMDTHTIEGNGSGEKYDCGGPKRWEQLNVPGLRTSISMSDPLNNPGYCASEKMTSGNTALYERASECHENLESIAETLFSDTQFTTALVEKSLVKRVDSLCCLLQEPTDASDIQVDGESCFKGSDDEKFDEDKNINDFVTAEDVSGCKLAPAICRKDSLGDLFLELPRIASLPRLLSDISEDG